MTGWQAKEKPRPYGRGMSQGGANVPSDFVLAHLIGDVVRLADGQGDDGQRGILRGPGGELAAVGDEQVLDVVGLAMLVHHAVAGLLRHAVGAEIVGGRIWRRAD